MSQIEMTPGDSVKVDLPPDNKLTGYSDVW